MLNVGYWLRHPRQIVPRIRYWLWERGNPEKPWLCPGTLRFLEQNLSPPMTGLEFGSGRSTAWFARRLGRLTSVEHHPRWHAAVAMRLERAKAGNVDYRLVPLDHREGDPERDAYEPLPRYVAVLDEFADETFDLIVVDGHYRSTCIRHSLGKLRRGGLLLVDDVNMWPSAAEVPVPKDWVVTHESTNGIKTSRIWRKPGSDRRDQPTPPGEADCLGIRPEEGDLRSA